MDPPEEPLERLAERLQAICVRGGISVATAESCTGGLVAHAITSVSGSSGYFVGAVVSYANGVKETVLGVPADVLEMHGAVSAQVALAMATGARDRLGADIAVGVTGVAGPDGGTPEKPVGLVYVAVSDRDGTDVRRFSWVGDRAANNTASAGAALRLLAERVERMTEAATAAHPAG